MRLAQTPTHMISRPCRAQFQCSQQGIGIFACCLVQSNILNRTPTSSYLDIRVCYLSPCMKRGLCSEYIKGDKPEEVEGYLLLRLIKQLSLSFTIFSIDCTLGLHNARSLLWRFNRYSSSTFEKNSTQSFYLGLLQGLWKSTVLPSLTWCPLTPALRKWRRWCVWTNIGPVYITGSIPTR